ncbi:MAG: hypothetical protein HY864_00135 [Chloroflexi bacterium]|nr:hypothetical protein [Chloroflexota bacterium]
MKTRNISLLFAANVLVAAMLACNIGAAPTQGATPPPQSATSSSESATEVPAITPAAEAGACTNPYLPVIVGATWNYKLTAAVPDTFTRSIVSSDETGFVDQDVFGRGVSRQGRWKCENGNLIALDPANGGSASVSSESVTVDFQTTELSGVTLPVKVNPGDSWTQNLTLEGTETINGTQMPARNQLTSTCTAVGTESVTVEAGTFESIRFDCQTIMNISVTMQGNPVGTTLTIDAKNWYVENIGLVKTTTTGNGLDSTVELVSYLIP